MKKAFGWLSVCAGLCLGAGCGKADDGGPIPRDEYASRVAQFHCDGLGACCKQQGFPFDDARCQSLYTLEYQQDLDEQGPSVTYDGQAAADCLASARGIWCSGSPGADNPACNRIFVVGGLEPGAPCTDERQCRSPAGGYAICDGVCHIGEPAGHGKLGEPCSFTCTAGESCFGHPGEPPAIGCYRSEGLYCSEAGLQPICQPLVALGQPCEVGSGCAGEDTFCSFVDLTCSAPRASGVACGADFECQSGLCDVGVCESQTVSASVCALQ